MDETLRNHLNNIRAKNKALQNEAYTYLLEATGQPVTWAYEAWDEIVAGLTDRDNRVRAITIIQDLRNLYDAVEDEGIKEKALALIETEEDVKYRKKYATVWRNT